MHSESQKITFTTISKAISTESNTFLKDFDGISMGFGYDVTFMADTSLQGAGMSRVSPEMEFSDRVDVV